MINALEERDSYTRGHSKRVTRFSLAIAGGTGGDGAGFRGPSPRGRLHDLGKIGVRDAVLLKPGKLTDEEVGEIVRHPGDRGPILEPIPSYMPLPPAYPAPPRAGSTEVGIPERLSGDSIPSLAIHGDRRHLRRDELHPRVQEALPIADAITRIRRCSGTQFDPDIVPRLLACHSKNILPGDRERLPEGFEETFPVRSGRNSPDIRGGESMTDSCRDGTRGGSTSRSENPSGIARRALEVYLGAGKIRREEGARGALAAPAGAAFVTLTKNGRLRGCIGYTEAGGAALQGGSRSAPWPRPRGSPLSPRLPDGTPLPAVEISVLTPLVPHPPGRGRDRQATG